jgi:HEAT repeat protein
MAELVYTKQGVEMRLVILSFLLGSCSLVAAAEEPEKNGVKLGEWIKRLSSNDVGVRNNAASIMILFGEEAAPATEALVVLLADKNPDVRRHAVTALGGIGPKAKSAADKILKSAERDENPTVRAISGRSLFRVDPGQAVNATESLVKFLTDHKTGGDRMIAIEALGEIGPKAKGALPQLKKVAEGSDKKEADAAHLSIEKIEIN